MGCKKFFNEGHAKKELGTKLQEADDVPAWELESASDYSLGVVEDQEMITRQIFSPIHVDEDGNITPAGLSEATTHGLSTNRLKYISELAVINKGIDKQNLDNQNPDRKPRNFIGITEFEVSQIREITDHLGVRGLAVFDTALENDNSHSDVFCFTSKKSWRSLRSKLIGIANKNFRLVYIIPSQQTLEK
ncbi:MAG: hypothetical protein H7069_05390 [Phormidesmis sp. FL-bin-119]|nr:hypothetical protein [Pedobacter sp.]